MDNESKNTKWIRPIIASAVVGIIILLFVVSGEKKTEWNLSSGPASSKYFETGSVLSSLANSNSKLSKKVNFVHLPSQGSKDNSKRLEEEKTELALIQNDTEAPLNVRTLMVLYQELLFFMVNKNSKISKFQDLYGKNVGLGPVGGGTESVFHEIRQHFEIPNEMFKLQNGSFSELSKLLIEGKIDALFNVSALDNQKTKELISNKNVDLIGFNSAGLNILDGLITTHPYFEESIVPSFAFPSNQLDHLGIPLAPKVTIGINALLVAPDRLEPSLVKEFIEQIYDNKSKIIRKSPHLHNMRIPDLEDKIQFPRHKGSEDYASRNNPSFLEKYSDSMAFILSVIILILGALKGLSERLKQKRKEIFDDFYIKINAIIDKSQDISSDHDSLEELTNKLDTIRQTALKLIVTEKLPADQNYQILLAMIHDCNSLIEKQSELIHKTK